MWSRMLRCWCCAILTMVPFAVKAFLPLQRKGDTFLTLHSKPDLFLYYSPNFHRHVVCERRGKSSRVVESFLWLDEAERQYPRAKVVPLQNYSASVPLLLMGCGLDGDSAYNLTQQSTKDTPPISMPRSREVNQRYRMVIEGLESKLRSPFFDFFPESQHRWVEERIVFLLSPLPKKTSQTDWPRAFCSGYGAGLSEAQATTAILALRHLLMLHPIDANTNKPPLPFFLQQLNVQLSSVDQARVELDSWLTGGSPMDAFTFAFLNTLDITWDQCRAILGAFSSSLVSCDLQPSWDLIESGPVRQSLSENAINYLRMRLQLSPPEVVAMIKTHSRLSTYSAKMLKLHLDALQSNLHLTSEELRRIAVRSPPMLGISTSKIERNIAFFSSEVNFTSQEIKKSILAIPTLLSCSVESNLMPKVTYLREDIGIAPGNLTVFLSSCPDLLASSLDRKIRPNINGLKAACGFSSTELRSIVVEVPQLMKLNWKTNLEPKISFLQERLGIDDSALKSLLASKPRLLLHSVSGSLEPKLRLLENAANQTEIVAKVVLQNPSLLLTSMPVLEGRIAAFETSNYTFADTFNYRWSNGSGKERIRIVRRKRPVMELADGVVVQTLADVETAASAAGTSRANMYHIIKTGRVFNGKSYIYGSKEKATGVKKPKAEKSDSKQKFVKDLRLNYIPSDKPVRLVEVLRHSPAGPRSVKQSKDKKDKVYLAAFVSGRAYPPEKQNEVQVKRKAGGLSIYFPQLRGSPTGSSLLRTAAERCFANRVMPNALNGTRYSDGLILFGYPYLRPSSRRCGLYVCREVLRFVLELLSLESKCPDLQNTIVEVEIFTDSNFAWDLLQNSTSLLSWGAYSRIDDFVYDGEIPENRAYLDILYPLARTYYRLSKQDLLPRNGEVEPKLLAKGIQIQYRHKSGAGWSWDDPDKESIGRYAEAAANWQYNRMQKL